MARPRKFYVIYGEDGAPSRIAHGLADYHAKSGKWHFGWGHDSRLEAEEHAAWRDYRLYIDFYGRTTDTKE